MLSQYLLFGPRAYHILDPKNLEAVQSTNFQGEVVLYVSDLVVSANFKLQTTTSACVMGFLHHCWGTVSLLKRDRLGSTPGSFYASNSFKHSIKSSTLSENTSIIFWRVSQAPKES